MLSVFPQLYGMLASQQFLKPIQPAFRLKNSPKEKHLDFVDEKPLRMGVLFFYKKELQKVE